MANRVIHFEIHASEPERAIEFYTSIFDWKISKWGEQDYWIIDTGIEKTKKVSPIGGINGGLLPASKEASKGTLMNSFVCTVTVDGFDETSTKILSSGGTLAVEKMDMKGVGFIGYFGDTEGNVFGILQPEAGNI